MALVPPRKHVSGGTWAVFCIFPFCDLLKIPLPFLDAIPVVGIAISLPVSLVISLIEVGGGGLGLLLTNFFGEGAESTTNKLWYMGLVMAAFAPIIDDIPFTTPVIFLRIQATQKADRAAEKEYAKKLAAQQHAHGHERQSKQQTAQIAAQRADAMRQQAMATSKAAANDTASIAEAA